MKKASIQKTTAALIATIFSSFTLTGCTVAHEGVKRAVNWCLEQRRESPDLADILEDVQLMDATQEDIDRITKDIKKNPINASLYRKRGRAYYWMRKYRNSLKDYNIAISLDDTRTKWVAERGNIHRYLGNEQMALNDYNEAIKRSPGRSEYFSDRARIYDDAGDLDRALEDYNKAIEGNRDPVFDLERRARLLDKMGQTENAIADYRRLAAGKDDYRAGQAREEIANLYIRQGNLDAALAELSEWVKKADSPEDALIIRARFLEATGKKDKADADKKEAIRFLSRKTITCPDYPWYYRDRADIYEELGNLKEAQKDRLRAAEFYTKEMNDKKKRLDSLENRAAVYDELNMVDRAMKDKRMAVDLLTSKLETEGDDAQLYHDRGCKYYNLQEYELALADFREAARLSPNESDYARHKAECLIVSGDLEQARLECKTGLNLDPYSASLLALMAQVSERTGEHENAIDTATRALASNSSSQSAYRWRAEAWKSLGQNKNAEMDFLRARLHD